MARAAVKAKQRAAKAAQPARPIRFRGRRRRNNSGNPNQQLFFMRLRRGHKWLYGALAIIFAIGFAGIGIGSGSNGLSQLYTGIFGGSGNPVSKAQGEIKKDPAKGYRDLATAYETKSDTAQAISALQSYLGLKKKDATAWGELGGLQLSQAQTYATQYQQAQQAAQLANPSTPFLPTGTLAQAVGTNPIYESASQQANTEASQLYQQATSALTAGVSSYQRVTKLQPHSATAWQQLASAAESAGNYPEAIGAWKSYLRYSPKSPQRKQIELRIKQLKAAIKASSPGSSSSSKSGK
jgi:tetratricopeptide (TPR) repeat protein